MLGAWNFVRSPSISPIHSLPFVFFANRAHHCGNSHPCLSVFICGYTPLMARDITGKTIIITGASSGIGEASAIECAKSGMNVVLNARRADRLESVADAVRSHGRKAALVVGDVTDAGMSDRLLDAADEEFGGFHAVFANAGYGLKRCVIDMGDEELRKIFEVNFFASFDLIQKAAQRLVEREYAGHLLMCSSCLSKFTTAEYAAYTSTKAAQNHFCWAMHIELTPHDIPVTSVNPIQTITEFGEASRKESGTDPDAHYQNRKPGMFVQPPERIGRAVVKCLRKPKPEVWTSHIVRLTAATGIAFPWVMEKLLRARDAKRRRAAR